MAYQNNNIPLSTLVELAQRAKLIGDERVQLGLEALAADYDHDLANVLLVMLQLKALAETLDPYPFDVMHEEDSL